jgi:hypothetical protein
MVKREKESRITISSFEDEFQVKVAKFIEKDNVFSVCSEGGIAVEMDKLDIQGIGLLYNNSRDRRTFSEIIFGGVGYKRAFV